MDLLYGFFQMAGGYLYSSCRRILSKFLVLQPARHFVYCGDFHRAGVGKILLATEEKASSSLSCRKSGDGILAVVPRGFRWIPDYLVPAVISRLEESAENMVE